MDTEAAQDPVKLEVFIDFVCPWCYLAHGVLQQLPDKRSLDIHWLPFPLHPDTPESGMLLSELFGNADIDAMHERLYAIMDESGLPYSRHRTQLFNTRKAQELLMWASDRDAGTALVDAMFHAYFVNNQNLADDQILRSVVQNAGLNPEEAIQALAERSFADDVDEAWQRARQYQLNGVPAFIGGGYQLSGYQPLEEMGRFVDYIKDA